MLDSKRIFVSCIDVPFVGADGVSSNDHSLNHTERVTFKNTPVHVGPRVSFISIAHHVFFFALCFAAAFPFHSSRKPAPAAASQPRGLDDFNDFMREISKEVLESLFDGEMTGFLGYEKYDHKSKETDNSRNGHSKKGVKSKFGEIGLEDE